MYNARVWEDGAFFGELPLLECGREAPDGQLNIHVYTATAIVETDCAYITQDDFDDLILDWPMLKTTMRQRAIQRAVRFGASAALSGGDLSLPSERAKAKAGERESERAKAKELEVRASVDVGTEYWLAVAKYKQPNLLEEELLELRALFVAYAKGDDDNDGTESPASIPVDTPGAQPAAVEDGTINTAEIRQILDDALERLFNLIDVDASGFLDSAEIGDLMDRLGQKVDESELASIMEDIDEDGAGEVDFLEFKAWWESRMYVTDEERERELKDLFSAVDKDGKTARDLP